MSALDAAIAASCPPWCTRERHPRWPGEAGGVVEVAHGAELYRRGDTCVNVHEWIEFAADGSVVESTSTLFVSGFDNVIVGFDEVAQLAAALAKAAEIVARAGVAA